MHQLVTAELRARRRHCSEPKDQYLQRSWRCLVPCFTHTCSRPAKDLLVTRCWQRSFASSVFGTSAVPTEEERARTEPGTKKNSTFGVWDKVTVVPTVTETVGLRSPDRSRHPPDRDFTSFGQPTSLIARSATLPNVIHLCQTKCPAFALQHVVDKHRHAGKPLYLCFVELKSAYDKVQWQLLWSLLQRLGVHGHMLGAVQSLYDGSLLSMRVNGQCGHSQGPAIGLRQGCPLSATLFGIFIDGLHHHLQTTAPAAGVQIRHLRLTDLVYADDICLLAGSPQHLQALIDALVGYCATLHMEISVAKTKVMVVSRSLARSPSPAAVVFTCNGLLVEHVDTFKYLGLHFHTSGDISHLITPLKAKAAGSWAVVQQRHSQLQCGSTVNLKLFLLQGILVPSLHYGCELWGMHTPRGAAQRARVALQSIYDRYLRHICGVKYATPSAMLLEELGLSPLQVFWWRRTLEFWNKIAASPVGSLFHTILIVRSGVSEILQHALQLLA